LYIFQNTHFFFCESIHKNSHTPAPIKQQRPTQPAKQQHPVNINTPQTATSQQPATTQQLANITRPPPLFLSLSVARNSMHTPTTQQMPTANYTADANRQYEGI
jgi:hypothetical protein